MPGTRGRSGGPRAGAGRKKIVGGDKHYADGRKQGITGIETRLVRVLHVKHQASEARRIWREQRRLHRSGQGPDPGPAPPKDDLEASIAFRTRLAVRIALGQAGDVRALMDMSDRAEGRPKYQVEQSGPEGAPIPVEVSGGVVFECQLPDGSPAFAKQP